ncbi:hypothetical protein Glove_595g12 [Diversispora epigaea]|uniref:Uncharacterized protein n=1 Tax=Diversispora epigaea TaxID=1348612 RepID=A0A397G7P1_9GLOM|nr:hypothetical protein Glove_595g12 [Diversispora epigaea]
MGVVYRTSHGWNNVNGGSVLPGFTLKVNKIDDAISPNPQNQPNEESEFNCPKYEVTFTDNYTFMEHFEDIHTRKWHKGE